MKPENPRGTQHRQIGEDTKDSSPALEKTSVFCCAHDCLRSQLYFSSIGQLLDKALVGNQFLALYSCIKYPLRPSQGIFAMASVGASLRIREDMNFKEVTFPRTRDLYEAISTCFAT